METVESSPVEIPTEELSEMAKAMLGVKPETAEVPPPAPDPEMETPEAEQVEAATDDEEVPETEQPAPSTIKELAEKLGISAEEMYGVKVSMPDGSEMTLGGLKDQHQTVEALNTERDTLDDRRIAFDTESSARQTEFDDLATVVGTENIPPQVKQAYDRFQQERSARETKALLATTPEWKDPVQREADQAQMLEHVQKFGMSEVELNALTSHKLVRIIKDAAKRAHREPKTPPKGQKPTAKPTAPRNDLKTIVSEARSGKRAERQALGDVLRARGL
jgi:hypothetical protein